jgi:hypothetical protein
VENPPGTSAYAKASASALGLWLELPEAPASGGPALDRPQSARQLALSAGEPPGDAMWLTLGVFALEPAGSGPATRLVHVAVSPEGGLRGAFFDMITGDVRNVTGAVDKAGRRAAWTVADGPGTVFEVPLSMLTEGRGQLTVHFPDGTSGPWALAQVAE